MKIDSHQHFWEYDPKRHEWIDESMKRIRRNFLPADLKPILDDAGIDGCVAVQADESLRETDFLLDLADQNPWIKAVVGWADLGADNLNETLENYSSKASLKGFREVLQGRDPEYMLREEFIRGIQTIGKAGYTYDILVFPHHLKATLELVKKCPEQAMVIDHLAKPYIKNGEWKDWRKDMSPIAERENILCKISGMVTEADWAKWTPETLLPYMEITLELFGPERCMYGSDWPVSLVAGEYEQIFSTVVDFTSTLSDSEQKLILGETATQFYNLH